MRGGEKDGGMERTKVIDRCGRGETCEGGGNVNGLRRKKRLEIGTEAIRASIRFTIWLVVCSKKRGGIVSLAFFGERQDGRGRSVDGR